MTFVDVTQLPADGGERAAELAALIEPLFDNEHPSVIGTALAYLLAVLLCGFRVEDQQRETLLTGHTDTVRKMLPDIEAEFRAHLKRVAS